jgi:GMP synthase-like glutamine amidotransferase
MFEIPRGGTLLASSEVCPHQALRCGSAVGLQFHVEVTESMLSEWFRGQPQEGVILRRHRELAPALRIQAERLYDNFLRSIRRT